MVCCSYVTKALVLFLQLIAIFMCYINDWININKRQCLDTFMQCDTHPAFPCLDSLRIIGSIYEMSSQIH